MTAERKAMTLADVRTELVVLEHDCHVSALTLGQEGLRAMCIEAQKRLHKLLPAIANLSRAAEPVANRVHVVCRWQGNVCEFIEVEDDSGHSVSIPWTYGKDGYSELILYAQPPESARDARDAARYRWLAEHEDADIYTENPSKEQLDRAIDAAMAQESGE